jgi:hypothetical protein
MISDDAGHSETPVGAGTHEDSLERREVLRRFGVYAACTAPAMTVLLASRQSAAGSFFNNGDAHRRGRSGLSGGGGGGGCGFSC